MKHLGGRVSLLALRVGIARTNATGGQPIGDDSVVGDGRSWLLGADP